MHPTWSAIPTFAITGGKGGTGKTLIATNLAIQFTKIGKKVLLIDFDVENPNTNILLGKNLQDLDVESKPVHIFKPVFDLSKCNQCGICREGCYRHAILQFPQKFPSLMEHMCSGCETCAKICPQSAINSDSRIIGTQYYIKNIFPKLDLLIGELNPSEVVSILIIKEILQNARKFEDEYAYDVIIFDTSPGAHCDVELVLNNASQIICITEPTPFGAHDLNRILDLVHLIHQKALIILNRANMTDYRDPIIEFAQYHNSPIIGEIPLDDIVIEDYAMGVPFVNDSRDFPAKNAFLTIFETVFSKITEGKYQ